MRLARPAVALVRRRLGSPADLGAALSQETRRSAVCCDRSRMNDALTSFTLAIPRTDLEGLNRRTDQPNELSF
jgi:hypothetical protein